MTTKTEELTVQTSEFFGGVDIFKPLSSGQLNRLAVSAVELSFPEGDIFKDNDDADGLYIVKNGMVKVTKSAADSSGVEVVLAILKPGDSFGELSLIDGLPRSANVVAMAPTICYFLPRDAFMLVLRENLEIAYAMLPALASMVRSSDQWVASLI